MMALSAIFILLYYFFLEREKIHIFKRFYLLFSILFSVFIPLISITYGSVKKAENIHQNNTEIMILPETKLVEPSIFTTENILLGIFLLGFTILLLKFSFGIFKLIKEIKRSEKIKQENFQIILKQNKITPYSFWNCIFLNKKDFSEGKIDAKIILHEKAHINQKHSIDVLFIEILLCVFWFNPAFYFYKKAMVTNHEFLADEAVLKQNQDVENYQKLILNELISEKILFTNPFNLNNTKKRIVMMTTKITKIAKLKSYLTLPISAILFFAFVEKVPSSTPKEKLNPKQLNNKEVNFISDNQLDSFIKQQNKEVINENAYEEFQKIISKYQSLIQEKKYLEFGQKITKEDKEKLFELYQQLSEQEKDEIPFILLNSGKLPKVAPTNNQFQDFKNSRKYGVWIDGKRVSNKTLNTYTINDFSQVFVSKRYSNAISKENPEPFQVNLMTNQYFQNYLNEKIEIVIGFKGKKLTDADAIKKPVELMKDTLQPKSQSNTSLLSSQSEEPAQFPGGNAVLRQKIMENIDLKNFKSKEKILKGAIHLHVLETGKDADIFADFENKEFMSIVMSATQKTIKGVTWKPGTKDGKPVDSFLKIPIVLNFE